MRTYSAIPAALWVVLALLVGGAERASAATLNLPPVADGTAFDQGGDGSFETVDTTDSDGLLSRNLAPTRIERALMNFVVPPFPGQRISAASLSGNVNLMQGLAGAPVPVTVVLYPGDGPITAADATRFVDVLARFDVTDLGPFTVPLDVDTVRQVLPQPATGGRIGIRLDIPGDSNGGPGIRIDSSEGAAFGQPPTLNITFVPEPSCAPATAWGCAALLLRRRRIR
jgi:hypothetical protein